MGNQRTLQSQTIWNPEASTSETKDIELVEENGRVYAAMPPTQFQQFAVQQSLLEKEALALFVKKNDELTAQNKKLEETLEQKDELIVILTKQNGELQGSMVAMFKTALEKVPGGS